MAQPAELNHLPPAAAPNLPAEQLPGRLLGIAYQYEDLIELIRLRVAELGVTQAAVDRLTGLPDQYAGKLLSRPPRKRLGVLSLGCVLSALGLTICVCEDPAQTLKIRPRLELRRRSLSSSQHWRKHSAA
jgi:hypothetical protein